MLTSPVATRLLLKLVSVPALDVKLAKGTVPPAAEPPSPTVPKGALVVRSKAPLMLKFEPMLPTPVTFSTVFAPKLTGARYVAL